VSTTEWLVLAFGLAAIAWINWYFFVAQRATAVSTVTGGIQTVEVEVRGGYNPGVIRVRRGTPARLISSCSEEVVIPEFGIRRFLPAFAKTPVEFTPDKSGTFDISCGMSMLHAKLVVEEGD
jgi:plastocyanin domain-containing protein